MTKTAAVEINKFVAGLITDASPLTFPENASLVDVNMELNSDGSRQRALGLNYENGYNIVSTTIPNAATIPVAFNVYRWENVAGNALKVIICVQFGNQVKFYDADNAVLSSSLIATRDFTTSDAGQKFSFSSVDGNLAIATGINLITVVTYASGVLSYSTDTIKVRDFFGVEDVFGSDDLTVGSGVQIRPTSMSNAHQYNLRNQSFGIPRLNGNSESLADPINAFAGAHGSVKGVTKFPSNADSVSEFLYADPNDTDDRNTKRYFPVDAVKNPLGTSGAAAGYYIIDILNRGASRNSEDTKNHTSYPELSYTLTTLPVDQTPGGASVVGEFAGRVWYGGFSGTTIGGDKKSPLLSSFIAFSQLVNNPSQITQCYQAGDPTSDTEPDIIDTDGGYIRLNNAYGVTRFVNLGKSFMILARNGIWRIYGGNDSGFSATNYVVEKITDKGVRGPGSVVQVESTLLYWSDDGIYWLKQNQFGDWISENQTQTRIQTLYNNISTEDKDSVIGVYDSFQRKVRWMYRNRLYSIDQQKELILDVNLNAFYERWISQVNGANPPVAIGGFNTNVFTVNNIVDNVVASGVQVVVGADNVQITTPIRSTNENLFETGYVVVTQISPTISYTFAAYRDLDFLDWKSFDGTGVDAPAVLITGQASGGDNMRYKQIPYVFCHMRRTEDGFVDDGFGDFIPQHQSSCTVQSMWDWSNSVNSGKWGNPFQAYRYKRWYFPVDVDDPYDTGYETVVTKNKLRGRGRTISVKFSSSPGKEMHLYGWSLILQVADNV